jgi:DNA gyrase/topoisomerase IV subunit B
MQKDLKALDELGKNPEITRFKGLGEISLMNLNILLVKISD